MRFAFITDELPRPGFAGHLAFNHTIIAWLQSNGHDVVLLLVRPRLHTLVARYDACRVVGIDLKHWHNTIFITGWRAGLTIFGRFLLGRLPAKAGLNFSRRAQATRYGAVDAILGAFVSPEQTAWCAGQIEKLAPDAVIADTIFRAPALPEPSLAQVRRIILAHDVFFLRHRALVGAGYKVFPPDLTQEKEARLLSLGDVVAAIQPEEAEVFRRMCPQTRVCTAPMPAQLCRRGVEVTKIPGRLVFIGSANLPNLDGLRWLFSQVWPILSGSISAVTLDLVGDCGDAVGALPPRVTQLGRVPHLSPLLHRAALAISPLRVGSGLKIKILDYARHGLVTVATRESLEGFAADDHAPFIAVSDAAGFAGAIAARAFRTDPADESRALDYVEKHYNVDGCFAGLAAALDIDRATVTGRDERR